MRHLAFRVLTAVLIGSPVFSNVVWASDEADRLFFESRIRPVLVEHCYECHAADAKQIGGQLRLDTRAGVLRGGESGAAVSVGNADESLLISALRYDDYEMPPQGQLAPEVIADFETWINHGLADPRTSEGTVEAVVSRPPAIDIEAGREFWAFKPPQRHTLPNVRQKDWPTRRIDYFVLGRLEQNQLTPSRSATRQKLIRRVAFDTTGLPPTPERTRAFLQDTRPDAYGNLIEEYLASPQFGERWGRLWLDVARYAEDQAHIVGGNQSLFYPNAHLYRAWVIESLNADLPYDEFLTLQLAADRVTPESRDQLVALGFLGLGPKYYRRNAPEVMADEWEDRVDTVTRGILGLTVACARCHDHKYDPIPTEDYYGLAGVFANTQMFNQPLDPGAAQDKPAKDPTASMHVVRDSKSTKEIHVHIRGDAFKKGALAPRRFLSVLSPEKIPLDEGSGRYSLAAAIVDHQNPLTARVIVNRIWAEYFGKGIVSTPSNFGRLGSRPSHPELLDDLAVRFMESGWSMKWLHREILLSSTYRQTSLIEDDELLERDPENLLLGRMSQRRLTVEQWRDAMLVASGELQNSLGGQSEEIHKPENTRRSVYAKVSRLELNSMMQRFDFPDPNAHAASRNETTTPLQKLFLLNSPFMLARAEAVLERVRREARPAPTSQRIERLFELLFVRSPTEEERKMAEQFLISEERWLPYTQALLATNEIAFID